MKRRESGCGWLVGRYEEGRFDLLLFNVARGVGFVGGGIVDRGGGIGNMQTYDACPYDVPRHHYLRGTSYGHAERGCRSNCFN